MTSLPPFLSPETARFLPVPDALREAFFPAKVCLFEWTDYWFAWPGATHLKVGSKRIAPFAPGLFRVRFENAIGASEIEPFEDENSLDAPFYVEVLSPKFPTPRAHFHFFGALLDDLFARAAPLPFDEAGQTARGVETTDLPPSPLWTRWFLTTYGAKVEVALHHFSAQPARDFEVETVRIPAHQAARFDADSLLQTLREPGVWRRNGGSWQPSHLIQSCATEQFDTPENRFVAAFARRLTRAIDALETAEFASLHGVSASISARFPPWNDEVTPSPALERRAVTRELLELWRLWRGTGSPLFGQFERAAKVRDIAQLWEFWTFFALCDEIGAALGQRPKLEMRGDDSRGMLPLSQAYFEAGTLVFNGPAPSYSTALRPDFLWLQSGAAKLAFDAKFRFEGDENSGRGRGADLHKMHAYRDALGVRAALALHPGAQSVFFDRVRGPLQHFSWRALLEGHLSGVGMRAMSPNKPDKKPRFDLL